MIFAIKKFSKVNKLDIMLKNNRIGDIKLFIPQVLENVWGETPYGISDFDICQGKTKENQQKLCC